MPNFLAFGFPVFEVPAIIAMSIVMIVTLTETTADILAVGEIIGTPIDQKRIANGLRADMLSSAIAPFFGTFMQSAFAQNVGLVAITGVKSRFVVAAGGAILVVLGLLPVMGRFIAAGMIPIISHDFFAHFPQWVQTLFHSGISSTCVVAVTLNIFFNHLFLNKKSEKTTALPISSVQH